MAPTGVVVVDVFRVVVRSVIVSLPRVISELACVTEIEFGVAEGVATKFPSVSYYTSLALPFLLSHIDCLEALAFTEVEILNMVQSDSFTHLIK